MLIFRLILRLIVSKITFFLDFNLIILVVSSISYLFIYVAFNNVLKLSTYVYNILIFILLYSF